MIDPPGEHPSPRKGPRNGGPREGKEESGCGAENLGHPNGALQIPRFARNDKKERAVVRRERLLGSKCGDVHDVTHRRDLGNEVNVPTFSERPSGRVSVFEDLCRRPLGDYFVCPGILSWNPSVD